jgi:hypothetical protein
MTAESWRCTDVVVVPDVVGLHVREAARFAHDAGLTLAQPDPDGPPLAALTWPDDYWITTQHPAAGTRLWRWDPLVVEWSSQPGHKAGVREPRRPRPPLHKLAAIVELPTNDQLKR